MFKVFTLVPPSVRPYASLATIFLLWVFAWVSGCAHWYTVNISREGSESSAHYGWGSVDTKLEYEGEITRTERDYRAGTMKALYGGTRFQIILAVLAITCLLIAFAVRIDAIKNIIISIPRGTDLIRLADNDRIRMGLIVWAFAWYFLAILFFGARHPACLYDEAKAAEHVPPKRVDYYRYFSGSTSDGKSYGPGPGWTCTLFPGLFLLVLLYFVDWQYERNGRMGCTESDNFAKVDESVDQRTHQPIVGEYPGSGSGSGSGSGADQTYQESYQGATQSYEEV